MNRVFTDCEYPHPDTGCVTCRPTEVLGARFTFEMRVLNRAERKKEEAAVAEANSDQR